MMGLPMLVGHVVHPNPLLLESGFCMQPSPALLTIEAQGDVQVITFLRDLFQEDAIAQVLAQLRQLVESLDQPRIVLNFARLKNVSSNFLGMVMDITLKTTHKKGQLRVCEMREPVKDLFELTRLDKLVPICGTQAQALQSLQAG